MLRIAPLGGLGEIGLNAMVFEAGGELLLVDCGLMFPDERMPGVGLVVPDFEHLKANRDKLKAVVLTHGHEDHIGALPFLLRDIPVPVYGTRFTLGLVRFRLEEMGVDADLRELEPRQVIEVGTQFKVEALRVTHSIPDGVGLVIQGGRETAVHTGDFKLDAAPIDGRLTDLARFGEYGERGVGVLLSDSTNAEEIQETGSEQQVVQAFDRLFRKAPGRVVVSMFASNIARIQHTFTLCAALGRKVVVSGRSMLRNVELAQQLGYLTVPKDLLISAEASRSLPPSKVVVLSTGSQAEPRSGLTQMAFDAEYHLPVERGDTFVLSARTIPGNERPITRLIDQLYLRGATVAHPHTDPGVHVSGHAAQPEQRRMLECVRPKSFVPIHGEVRHLRRHMALAQEVGLSADRTVFAQDGDLLELVDGRVRIAGRVPSGRTYRDQYGGGELPEEALAERARMAETGVVVAAVVLDRNSGAIVGGPHLSGRGITALEARALQEVVADVKGALAETTPQLRLDDAFMREEVVRAVRRALKQRTSKRPVVMPVVVKL